VIALYLSNFADFSEMWKLRVPLLVYFLAVQPPVLIYVSDCDHMTLEHRISEWCGKEGSWHSLEYDLSIFRRTERNKETLVMSACLRTEI
jgi:hypothetical protein